MKITRRQLGGLIRKTLSESSDELSRYREKIIALVQTGEIDRLNQALELNDMLGIFDDLELEKEFWKQRQKDIGWVAEGPMDMISYISSAAANGHRWSPPAGDAGGFSPTNLETKARGPFYEGTIDNLFNVILDKFLSDTIPLSGLVGKNGEADWEWIENKPGLVAMFRESFDTAIDIILNRPDDTTFDLYHIIELLPASEPSIKIVYTR